MSVSNYLSKALVAATATAVVAAVATVPSHADDSRTFGSRTCAQGSPFIETGATGTITHRINRPNLSAIVKTYVNGGVQRTNRTGASAPTMSSGRADTDRIIYSARSNCAD